MKVTKKEAQVVTPPPTYDITGLTGRDVAVLRALLSSPSVLIAKANNSFLSGNKSNAVVSLKKLHHALFEADPRSVYEMEEEYARFWGFQKLPAGYDTNRDPGDEA